MASDDQVKCVLVTGASGFIASHIIQQLLQAGHKVRGTVRSLSNETKVKHLKDLCPDAAHELELVEADLSNEQCWASAVKDCSHVLHVASPFPIENPADENELIRPAVQGTTFVLQACADAGTVKRVVLTSSVAAIIDPLKSKSVYTEDDWPDPANTINAYNKSKTLAEKAAWELVKELPDDKKFELSVMNPAYVIGPVLSGSSCSSMEMIKRILDKDPPANARLHVGVIDVRDVARAHIVAMTAPEAAGHRHILSGESLWMVDFAQIIKDEFQQHGYSISTMVIPKLLFKVVTIFDSGARAVKSMWDKEFIYDNTRLREVLNVNPIPAKTSIVDMAYSMIEGGFTKKHKHYKGRPTLSQDQRKGTGTVTTDANNAAGEVAETGGNVAENTSEAKVAESNGEVNVAETNGESNVAETTEEVNVADTNGEVNVAETNGEVNVAETNGEVNVAETTAEEVTVHEEESSKVEVDVHVAETETECAESNTQTDEPES